MSTVGHPLSDLSNFLTPFYTAHLASSVVNARPAFLPGVTPGLPTPQEIAALYYSASAPTPPPEPSDLSAARATGSIPWVSAAEARERERELRWGQAFNIFRQSAICQGIAARQAARQASSERAKGYADARAPLAEYAWQLIEEVQELEAKKPRL